MHTLKLLFVVLIIFWTNTLSAKAPLFTEKDYLNHPPRIIRTCCAFGTDLRVSIIPVYRYTMLTTPDLLGPHHYLGDKVENNGIVYTRRGGFVDFGHLRDAVDWTAYLYNLEKRCQQSGELTVHLGFEDGVKGLYLKIPATEKDEDLIKIACRIAYDLSIWHEITTWFGAAAVPLVSEKFSSFSIEDAYSNLLGTTVGAKAIKSDLPFEEAVTKIISQTLVDLESVTTKDESYQAMEAVRDIWWTRKKPLPNNHVMLERELGVYANMQPWLVPGWESKNPLPLQIELPDRTNDGIPLSEFYTLTIKGNHKIPVKKIFHDRSKRLITQNDFIPIIDYVGTRMLKENIKFKK